MIIKRFGEKSAFRSLIGPVFFYLFLSYSLFIIFYPYLWNVNKEFIFALAFIGIWRYSLMIINYIRALYYSKITYPNYLKKIASLEPKERYPKHIYFIIPSYKEDAWVSTEVFQSILADVNTLTCKATLIVSTGADYDDSIITNVYEAHPNKENIKLVFQRQDSGKRVAMGYALRYNARDYNSHEQESITIFMDGDTYLPLGTLKKSLPIFAIEKDVGAVTTNEIAYIDSKSKWYKDWFNLKFSQRHILFQSQSLSKRVLTLTGRFSIFRTTAVITEDFISMIENDIIIDSSYGKFRFLMGDDKSSWYNLMKNGWQMLYLPDVLVYSLESRDGNFLDVSQSLPYRWYGNTLRNNARARALTNQPLFIRYLFWDQLALMWTSIVGINAAIFLALFDNFAYFPLYIGWVFFVRVIQMSIFAYFGHIVSYRTIPLMLYSQWVGSYVKIKAYFHLSDQSWSKKGGEVQTADDDIAPIFAKYKYFSIFRMSLLITLFLFFMITMYTDIFKLPSKELFNADFQDSKITILNTQPDDNKDDAKALNALIRDIEDNSTILLPSGILDIYEPINITRSNISIVGQDTILLSHLDNTTLINIRGSLGKYVGKTKSSVKNALHVSLETDISLKPKDLLLIQNLKIIEVAKYDKNILTMNFKNTIAKGASIYKIDDIHNVNIKNISIELKERANGVKITYASHINLVNISIKNSFLNDIIFENTYQCFIDNISNMKIDKRNSFHNYFKE
jgi:glycosyltransferase Alg8